MKTQNLILGEVFFTLGSMELQSIKRPNWSSVLQDFFGKHTLISINIKKLLVKYIVCTKRKLEQKKQPKRNKKLHIAVNWQSFIIFLEIQ